MSAKLPHSDRTLLLYALSDPPQFTTVRGRQTLIEEPQWRNQGSSMITVRNRLKAQASGLLAEMAVLD